MGKKNPRADRLNKQITIRAGKGTITYYMDAAGEIGIPY